MTAIISLRDVMRAIMWCVRKTKQHHWLVFGDKAFLLMTMSVGPFWFFAMHIFRLSLLCPNKHLKSAVGYVVDPCTVQYGPSCDHSYENYSKKNKRTLDSRDGNYNDVTWAPKHIKSAATGIIVQNLRQVHDKEIVKVTYYWILLRKSPRDKLVLLQRVSNVESVCMSLCPHANAQIR